jgi:hypothetical protein
VGKRFIVDSTIAFDQSVAAGAGRGALAREPFGNAIVAWAKTNIIIKVAIITRAVVMLFSPEVVLNIVQQTSVRRS